MLGAKLCQVVQPRRLSPKEELLTQASNGLSGGRGRSSSVALSAASCGLVSRLKMSY